MRWKCCLLVITTNASGFWEFCPSGKAEVNQAGKSGQLAEEHGFLSECLSEADEFTFCSKPFSLSGPEHLHSAKKQNKTVWAWKSNKVEQGATIKRSSLPREWCNMHVGLISCTMVFSGSVSSTLVSKNKGSINLCRAGHLCYWITIVCCPLGEEKHLWTKILCWKTSFPRLVFLCVLHL